MGRPKGYRLSQETRDRISAGARRGWARRREWLEVSNSILRAGEEGDYDRASALLDEWLAERHADVQASMSGLSTLSRQDVQDAIADMSEELDELHAETLRVQAERRAVTESDIEAFCAEARRYIRSLTAIRKQLTQGGTMDKNSEHSSIPSPTERMAAQRRAANALQGEFLGDDAAPYIKRVYAADGPVVGQSQTRHARVTGIHTHEHAAHGESDAEDGIHSHSHEHKDDSEHNHAHWRM